MAWGNVPSAPDVAGSIRHTAVGLWEDEIDAEQALTALRKAHESADRVSVAVRDKAADEGTSAERSGAVARAITATALGPAGGWLHGLTSLIVPERGTFVVAGPIGAVLAGVAGTDAPDREVNAGGLFRTLVDFGFSPDEATYLEHRLAAGITLIAVTTDDESTLQTTRRLFADHNAVHIGMAITAAAVFAEAEALLNAPPEVSSGGDVVVTDAVAPLRRVSTEGGSSAAAALRHRDVVDDAGEELGKIEEIIEEEIQPGGPASPDGERRQIRYVVVGFGGVLGLGRHHVAVPAALADLDADPIRLRVDKRVVQRAPPFDEDAPFSRREERAICAYFGCDPYWLRDASSGP